MASNSSTQSESVQPALVVTDLSKTYVRGTFWRHRVRVLAAKNVSFEIPHGKTLALVGESGSGKSTVARCVARLETPDSGKVSIGGEDLESVGSRALLGWHSQVQMVFQDAVTSMNPRFTAAQVVEEPLLIRGSPAEARRAAAQNAIIEVGLTVNSMMRPVSEFSGGQRQRLALARTLLVRAKLLVLDEALTGLDPSTQAQIANLLFDLQAAHSLSYLLISHDLGLVSRMADQIAVMSKGQIVEVGPTGEIMVSPQHEQTIRLLTAARTARQNLTSARGMPA